MRGRDTPPPGHADLGSGLSFSLSDGQPSHSPAAVLTLPPGPARCLGTAVCIDGPHSPLQGLLLNHTIYTAGRLYCRQHVHCRGSPLRDSRYIQLAVCRVEWVHPKRSTLRYICSSPSRAQVRTCVHLVSTNVCTHIRTSGARRARAASTVVCGLIDKASAIQGRRANALPSTQESCPALG